jgi:hypothetical protein
MEESSMGWVQWFAITFPIIVQIPLQYISYGDRLLERTRSKYNGRNSALAMERYLKWYMWRARKRADYLLLVSDEMSVDTLKVMTKKFSRDDFTRANSTSYFLYPNGRADPALEMAYQFVRHMESWEHVMVLEEAYGFKVEEHHYSNSVYFEEELEKYRKFATMRGREKKIEILNAS